MEAIMEKVLAVVPALVLAALVTGCTTVVNTYEPVAVYSSSSPCSNCYSCGNCKRSKAVVGYWGAPPVRYVATNYPCYDTCNTYWNTIGYSDYYYSNSGCGCY